MESNFETLKDWGKIVLKPPGNTWFEPRFLVKKIYKIVYIIKQFIARYNI